MKTDIVTPDFRIDTDDMVLNIYKILLNPAVIHAHNQVLQKPPAKYPFLPGEGGGSGGAKVLGKLPVPGRPTI